MRKKLKRWWMMLTRTEVDQSIFKNLLVWCWKSNKVVKLEKKSNRYCQKYTKKIFPLLISCCGSVAQNCLTCNLPCSAKVAKKIDYCSCSKKKQLNMQSVFSTLATFFTFLSKRVEHHINHTWHWKVTHIGQQYYKIFQFCERGKQWTENHVNSLCSKISRKIETFCLLFQPPCTLIACFLK